MQWILLAVASLFEIAWALGLKESNGFTKLVPSVLTIVCMMISLFLLAMATKNIPIGTAYAVWTGFGAVGTAIGGMVFFNESKELIRIFFIGIIVIGLVGLKIFSK